MADDTRLADASLLLNYSNQSYKEQQMQLQGKGLAMTNAISNPELSFQDSSKAATNSRRSSWDNSAHRPLILSNSDKIQRGTSPQVDQYITLSTNGLILPTSPDFLSPCPPQPLAQQISTDKMTSYANKTPMDNLFDAVNCALPTRESKPISAEAPVTNLTDIDDPKRRIWAHPVDHDYCVKSPKQSLKLVAIHLGAGTSTHNEAELLKIAKSICEEVMLACQSPSSTDSKKDSKLGRRKKRRVLPDQYDAESAVVQLVKRMEDHQALNCGFGSNLNFNGQVECDASMMSDKTQMWAGVGSVAGCKNPIVLVKSLYDHRNQPRPLGLIQPNLLVGSGARQWMRENCPSLAVAESKLISAGAFGTYQKLKSRYDHAKKNLDDLGEASKSMDQDDREDISSHLDTVGAVAVDCDNNFASAISSGGLLLKYKGRVGQAAVPGAGCWSESSVAITTTGVGEYLTLSLFARKVFEKMQTLRLLYDLGHVERNSNQSNVISAAVEECFEELVCSPALAHVKPHERRAGLLSVETFNRCESGVASKCNGTREKSDLYLTFAHNTPTMCVGYMTCDDIVGHSIMSRQLNAVGSATTGTNGCGGSSNDLTSGSSSIGGANGLTESKLALDDSHNNRLAASSPTIVRTIKFSLDSETRNNDHSN